MGPLSHGGGAGGKGGQHKAGPWGHEPWRAGRAGRAEGAGMDWGPLKSAYRREGHGARRHEATGP